MMKDFIKKHILLSFAAALMIGLLLGWLLFRTTHATDVHQHSGGKTMYTCSMHPQVRQDPPGKCPICGMDLIPVNDEKQSAITTDSNAIVMSDEAVALANIETEVVGSGATNKEVRLFGKILPDQRLEQTQSSYVEGRIEKLLINASGDRVSRGQALAVIYSPTLYAIEQELIAALNFPESPQKKPLIDAAIEKLRLLNITQAQINQLMHTRKASPYTTLTANTSGTVIQKNIKQGQVLMKIANLGKVWAMFQAYESDLPFIHVGEKIHFTTEAMPGKVFTGSVSFVDPMIDPSSRTAGVRVEMNNTNGWFKPEMTLTGNIVANMKQYHGEIIVPKSAVMWTGKRSIVYVKDTGETQATFRLRRVTLGPSLSNGYVITDGLAEGEEIVTNGTFAVDASAQLAGKESMMNQ